MNRTESQFPYFVAPVGIFGHPVSPQARFVYLALAARVSEGGWLSYAALQEDTALPQRSMLRALKELQAEKLVTIHASRRLSGGQFTYTLYPPKAKSFEDEEELQLAAEPADMAGTGSVHHEAGDDAGSTEEAPEGAGVAAGAKESPLENEPASEADSEPKTCEEESGLRLAAEPAPIAGSTEEAPEGRGVAASAKEPPPEDEPAREANSEPKMCEEEPAAEVETPGPANGPAPELTPPEEPLHPCILAYREAFEQLPPRSLVEDWKTLPDDYILAQLDYCHRIHMRESIKNVPVFVRTALEHDYAEHSTTQAESRESCASHPSPHHASSAKERLEAVRDALQVTRRKQKKQSKRKRRKDPWGPLKEPK